MKHLLVLLFTYATLLNAQSPLSEIEGRLSIYMPNDSTSLFIGKHAGAIPSDVANRENTFVGTNAGSSNTTENHGAPYRSGSGNSFFGASAGENNRGGSNNSFFGNKSGLENTIGYQNSFFGARAGQSSVGYIRFNNSGLFVTDNSFFGFAAGANNTTGIRNAFFGSKAGATNKGPQDDDPNATIDDGTDNAYFGYAAGMGNQNGHSNVYIGSDAGHSQGSNSVALGYRAGVGSFGNYNIIIGNEAGPPQQVLTTETNNKLFIDVNTSNTPLIYGEFDNDLIRINGKLETEDGSVFMRNLGNGDTNQGIKWGEANDGEAFGIVYDGEGTATDNRLHIKEYVTGGPGTLMTIKGTGEIGIGTEAPNAPLHINQHMRLEPTTTPPTCQGADDEGRMYYDKTLKKFRGCVGFTNGQVSHGWVNLH